MGSAFIWPIVLHRAFLISSPMSFSSAILARCLGFQIGEHFSTVLYREIRRTDRIFAFTLAFALATFSYESTVVLNNV